MKIASVGSATVKRCSLVGVGEVLLEEGVVFGVPNTQARLSVSFFLLPADPDVEISTTSPAPSACVPP